MSKRWSAMMLTGILVFVAAGLAGTDVTKSGETGGKFNVGFALLNFPIGAKETRNGTLDVAVWYPTRKAERPDSYADGTRSRFAYRAKADRERGAHPLVVLSHGYGGSGIGSICLSEHLARHGFVVAAPDHSDDRVAMRISGPTGIDIREYFGSAIRLGRSGKEFDRSAHSYRPRELSLTIDKVLEESEKKGSFLEGAVDPERIGAAGHSLGGYTVLEASGVDEKEKDERIRAALLLSGGVFMFEPEEFRRVRAPVMFMYGEREASRARARLVNPKGTDTMRAYKACRPPKFLLEIRDANHFAFGQIVFSERWPGAGRELGERIADVVNRYSLAFFARYLNGNKDAEKVLLQKDDMISLFATEMD